MSRLNDLGQPIGPDLPGWTPRPQPTRTPMAGRQVRLEPLEPKRHARELYEADRNSEDTADWTYLPNEPMHELADYEAWCAGASTTSDPLFFAIVDLKSGRAVGRAALMRIDATNGVMEVGHIKFSPLLQRSALATEAMFLMMRRAFDELGYRRFEWKCDNLNEPVEARRAAIGLHLRRPVSQRRRREGPQPRHGVVFDHRQRMAEAARRFRTLARTGEFRGRWCAEGIAVGDD